MQRVKLQGRVSKKRRGSGVKTMEFIARHAGTGEGQMSGLKYKFECLNKKTPFHGKWSRKAGTLYVTKRSEGNQGRGVKTAEG